MYKLSAGLIPKSGISRSRECVFVCFIDFARLKLTRKLYSFWPLAYIMLWGLFWSFNKNLLSTHQGLGKC